MNIGVDVDGVLVDIEKFQLEVGAKYFKKKYGYDVVNPAGFDIADIFNCTHKERMSFWIRYIWKHIIFNPAMENASYVLNKLRSEGHNIYIITGRVFVTKKNFLGWLFRTILHNWLKRHNVQYDDIYYCDEHNSIRDKVLGCKKYGIDVMVEDNAENVLALSEITKAVCFDAGYNRDCEGENIVRAHNWGECYEIIKDEYRTHK